MFSYLLTYLLTYLLPYICYTNAMFTLYTVLPYVSCSGCNCFCRRSEMKANGPDPLHGSELVYRSCL